MQVFQLPAPKFLIGEIVWHIPSQGPTKLSRVVNVTKDRNRGYCAHYVLQPILEFPHDPNVQNRKSNNVPEYNIKSVGDVTDLCHLYSRLGSLIHEIAKSRGQSNIDADQTQDAT